MTTYEAAIELIREININLEVGQVHRDTETDHRALTEARQRYDQTRRRR